MKDLSRSTWNQFIIFCNTYNVNEKILRRDILKNVIQDGKGTIDMYRKKLTTSGYIGEVERGKYKLLKKIPDLLMSDCKSFHKSPIGKVLDSFDKAINNTEE